MTTTERLAEYRFGQRSVLRPGVRFRANKGPLFQLADGTQVSVAAHGPFIFRAYVRHGSTEWIEATDRDGGNAILHIKGQRKQVDEALIPRPYTIRSLIRKKHPRR